MFSHCHTAERPCIVAFQTPISVVSILRVTADRTSSIVHDPDYRASLNDWNTFVEVLTQKLIGIDELVPELPIKDIVSVRTRSLCSTLEPFAYTASVTFCLPMTIGRLSESIAILGSRPTRPLTK